MKKIFCIAIVLVLISCKNENPNQLQLSGNIEGLKQGTITIKKIEDTSFVTLDSIIFDGNSQFETNFELKSPEVLYVFLDRGQTQSIDNSVMFFAEPGKMTFNSTLEKFYADAKVTGSKHNEIYEVYLKMKQKFTEKNIEWINFELKNRNKNINWDSINNLKTNNEKRKSLYALNFAKTNKDFHVAPFVVISDVNVTKITYLKEVYEALNPEIKKGKYGLELKKIIDENNKK
ncbi:MAG: DUF4369 domain-containing protein [Flavobacterium sp.]